MSEPVLEVHPSEKNARVESYERVNALRNEETVQIITERMKQGPDLAKMVHPANPRASILEQARTDMIRILLNSDLSIGEVDRLFREIVLMMEKGKNRFTAAEVLKRASDI